MCIDQQLYDQIPDTDYRKKNFVEEAEGNYPAYIAVKFNSANYRQDEVYMRLSEAYLLKAEAEARKAEAEELALAVTSGGVLPCGTTARWTPDA